MLPFWFMPNISFKSWPNHMKQIKSGDNMYSFCGWMKGRQQKDYYDKSVNAIIS